MSEIPIDHLQNNISALERRLALHGYGLYSVDYTQDFSGTLDRCALVDHLVQSQGMHEAGTDSIADPIATILDNTDSVGNHVVTYMQTTPEGYMIRAKLYNKVVSNFEAGTVREKFGAHLAEYADCPNKHLQKTFLHPDVQARGCTRIEVSVYATRELCSQTGQSMIDGVLCMATPTVSDDQGLFVIQPPKKQWENLGSQLDRCCLVANRPSGTISIAWYAHTKTKRVAGIEVKPKGCKNDETWEKAVKWVTSEFGFRCCPIFRIDILKADDDGIELGPLRCFNKGLETATVLASSRTPTQQHTAPPPSELLPDTPHVAWIWHPRKVTNKIGVQAPTWPLQEIEHDRYISALSTKERRRRQEDIASAMETELWRAELQQKRAAEIAMMQYRITKSNNFIVNADAALLPVLQAFVRSQTKKLSEIVDSKATMNFQVLGFRYHGTKYGNSSRLAVRIAGQSNVFTIWGTNQIQKILERLENHFHKHEQYQRTTFYMVPGYTGRLELLAHPKHSFYDKGGKLVEWNEIEILNFPTKVDMDTVQDLLEDANKAKDALTSQMMKCIDAPPNKFCKRAIDVKSGEYTFERYAVLKFRGSLRTIVFLKSVDRDDEDEVPVFGYFLEQKLKDIDLSIRPAPMHCYLTDTLRPTPNSRKDRIVEVA